MATIKKIVSWIWLAITIILGIGALVAAVFPQTLSWVGIRLTDGEIVVGVRVFLVTALWFIFGHNGVTKTVAELEKSGPLAIICIGVLIGVILEGGKLVEILSRAGFGWTDILVMLAGFALVAIGIIWAVRSYIKRS